MYLNVYVYSFVHSICLSTYTCMCICVCTCICTNICTCMCTCMCTCICTCICVCHGWSYTICLVCHQSESKHKRDDHRWHARLSRADGLQWLCTADTTSFFPSFQSFDTVKDRKQNQQHWSRTCHVEVPAWFALPSCFLLCQIGDSLQHQWRFRGIRAPLFWGVETPTGAYKPQETTRTIVHLFMRMCCFVLLTQGWGAFKTKAPVARKFSPKSFAFTMSLQLFSGSPSPIR